MNTMLTLVRRELLEHRAIYVAPAIVAAIILAGTLFGVFKAVGASDQVMTVLNDINGADPARAHQLLQRAWGAVLLSLAMPFNLVMSVVTAFYLLDCLHGERKDRSVLFWRSLPVTDTQTVLSKLLTGLVAIAVVELLAVLAASIVNGVVISGGLLALGQNPLRLLWLPAPWISGPVFLAYSLAAEILWYAPFAGWLLLVSAAARQAPMLWALGLPAAVMYLERLMLGSSSLFDVVVGHLNVETFFEAAMRDGGGDFALDEDDWPEILRGAGELDGGVTPLLELPDPGGFLATPALWAGLAVTAAFTAIAIRMRRYHDV